MPAPLAGIGATVLAAVGVAPLPIGNGSPLGRFSGVITAGVTVMALAFAFLTHVGAFGWSPDPFIDLVASIAVGVVFGRGVGISEGQTVASSSASELASMSTRLALAAHDRLDKINAPAVPLDHTQTTVGAQSVSEGS